MAALTPGGDTKVAVAPEKSEITDYVPVQVSYSLSNSVGVFRPGGYEYHPPDSGQLWPRGDYAPTG